MFIKAQQQNIIKKRKLSKKILQKKLTRNRKNKEMCVAWWGMHIDCRSKV